MRVTFSNYPFLKGVLKLTLHFSTQRQRTLYWGSLIVEGSVIMFVFYYVREFEECVLFVKHVRILLQHGFYNLSFSMGQMV